MKLLKLIILSSALFISTPGFAKESTKVDSYDALIETAFIRPVSFVGLAVGSALFVGISPLTALASIPAPHNAFELLADILVVKPAKFTFVRPIGDYEYNEGLE